MRWNTIRRWCKSLIQDSPSGSLFTLGQLSCFFPHLTGPWTLPKMHARLFSKMDPTPEACGCMSTLIMGWGGSPFLFWPSRRLLAHAQTGKSSLTSGVGTLSLCFSRAQLLPLALSLECLGEKKAWILFHLTNTRCPAQRPTISCLNTVSHIRKPDIHAYSERSYQIIDSWIKTKNLRDCQNLKISSYNL